MKEGEQEIKKGKFILFEGIGGAGKSTQILKAKDYLEGKGISVIATREPGGGDVAEHIRQLIFTLKGEGLINADSQTAFFYSSRYIWHQMLANPTIDSGTSVLTDRYSPSTGAYQGYAEGGDIKTIEQIGVIVAGDYKPDAAVLLRIAAETSLKRKIDREGDPFDEEGLNYTRKLVYGYDEMAENGWGGISWYKIDGESEEDDVFVQVQKVLDEIFELSN